MWRQEFFAGKKLYELIRKRTIACQMADAELERTTISVGISGQTERFVAVGEVISFEGFLQVYMESNDDDTEKEQENGLLPPVKLHETLSLKDIVATERFTQRPPRYTGNQSGSPFGRIGHRTSVYLCADYPDDPEPRICGERR